MSKLCQFFPSSSRKIHFEDNYGNSKKNAKTEHFSDPISRTLFFVSFLRNNFFTFLSTWRKIRGYYDPLGQCLTDSTSVAHNE